jgi:hypothetical protein
MNPPPGELWRLHKPACGRMRQAVVELHQIGGAFELRLSIDGAVERSEAKGSRADGALLGDEWKRGLIERGWR